MNKLLLCIYKIESPYKNYILNGSYSSKGNQFERFLNGQDIKDANVKNNRSNYYNLRKL